MAIFKKTTDILSNKWAKDNDFLVNEFPKKYEWLKNTPMTFDDVDVWEQIYHQPGNIGIYAAWSPYQEIYIIVYNQFMNQEYGIEIYEGSNASSQVLHRAKEFNIELTESAVWI